ncbi:putative quinol monooxygenase [Ectobacillus sp. sgz5001026]|uniref:putative quinol monooxygenase n=1 Tax=Ectobacillus sp. sgz5001026 TaxID=3242473 RepID=UPI0036D20AEA
MVTIQGFMQIKPEFHDEFIEKLALLLQASRTENGNIDYNLYENVEKPNHFVMLEQWESEEVLAMHSKTPHYISFRKYVQDVLAAPPEFKRM